jgi:hypothetical protein
LRLNPDGFAPEVRAEMGKLFWWGIRAPCSPRQLADRRRLMRKGDRTAPITTHAVYDFVALVYFLRAHVRPHRAARIKD